MRFRTEFKITQPEKEYARCDIFKNRKNRLESELGEDIAKVFGWQNPVDGSILHHRLEIEAFPMEKWIEFKNKILNMKLYYQSDIHLIEQYIKELESFGKPAGDAIINNTDK